MPKLFYIIFGTRFQEDNRKRKFYKKFHCVTPDVVTAASIVNYLNNTQTKWTYSWEYIDCYESIQSYHYYEDL